MGILQFCSSLRRITRHPEVDRPAAVARHIAWQVRRWKRDFPVELPLSNSVLIARSGQCGVSALVNSMGMYDHHNMHLVKEAMARGGVFVDVGANIGCFTVLASEAEAATVVAIEAHPDTFRLLSENVARNGRRNVRLVCAAASDRAGECVLTDTPGSPTTHIVRGADAPGLHVPTVRLDAILAEHGLEPTVLKIDVEGFEREVILGLGDAIRHVELVFVEINGLSDRRGSGADAVVAALHAAGMAGPLHYDHGTRRIGSARVHAGEDSVFVRRSRVQALQAALGITIALAD